MLGKKPNKQAGLLPRRNSATNQCISICNGSKYEENDGNTQTEIYFLFFSTLIFKIEPKNDLFKRGRLVIILKFNALEFIE